ncbi:MAG: porin [Gammaproteobacteria bacterium]|nr:porin [Gammaproteobacteria bacterium]
MKKLIVAAVAAAVSAPVALMADATLYGKAHVAVGHYTNGLDTGDSNKVADNNISSNASRVGVKGSEDLGGGMKAVYNFEWGVQVDENDGVSGRHSYVGLAGGFGTAIVGMLNSPHKMVSRKVDLFGDRNGDLRSLSGSVDEGYVDNVIAYVSPSFGGVTVTAAYSTQLNGDANDNNDNAVWSGSVEYKNGPIYVGLGHTDALDVSKNTTHTRLGGSVAMGPAKILASYSINDFDGTNMDNFHVGASFAMGNNTLKAQYAATKNDGDDNDGSNITLAVDHKMSKNTTVYVEYSVTDNDDMVNGKEVDGEMTYTGYQAWKKTGVGSSAAAGEKSTAFAVGLIHKF